MESYSPDAVVFMIGTNDTPVVNQVDANGDGVPDWQADYRLKVARMMDLFVGSSHRTVFWLGPPTLGTRSMDRGAVAIGQVMREEAAKRAPDVVYIDTYKLFSTTDGRIVCRAGWKNASTAPNTAAATNTAAMPSSPAWRFISAMNDPCFLSPVSCPLLPPEP